MLFTARVNDFENADQYRIIGLPEVASIELFRKYYPKFKLEETDLFKQIRTAVGENTLVLELLAKNLNILNHYRKITPSQIY